MTKRKAVILNIFVPKTKTESGNDPADTNFVILSVDSSNRIYVYANAYIIRCLVSSQCVNQ